MVTGQGRGGLPEPGNWTMRPGPKESVPCKRGMSLGLEGGLQVTRIPFGGRTGS